MTCLLNILDFKTSSDGVIYEKRFQKAINYPIVLLRSLFIINGRQSRHSLDKTCTYLPAITNTPVQTLGKVKIR